MRLLLLSLSIICLCICSKTVDELLRLDKLLVTLLKELKMETGGQLLNESWRYYCMLYDITKMIEKNDTQAHNVFYELEKHGGPQFVYMDINRDLMEEKFNWSVYEWKDLEATVAATKRVWNEMPGVLNYTLHPPNITTTLRPFL